jgi:hypothetical protein
MKYALKIVRDVGTRDIMVFPVKQCRNDQTPYVRRTKGVCVELLRVFNTREEAVAAEKAECMAAVLMSLSDEELAKQADEDYDFLVYTLGMSRKAIAEYMKCSPNTLRKQTEGVLAYNVRSVARLHYIVEQLKDVKARVDALLPKDETTGHIVFRGYKKAGK